jgi:MATE family multidrug resistance protein
MIILFLSATGILVNTFASGFEGDTEDITRLAATMLRLATIYILADSAQLVFAGALRGAGDTRWVMRVSVGLHWIFSALAVFFIRFLRLSPVISWSSFIGFVLLLGVAMFLRFRGGKWQEIRMIE